jgi:RNA polymerase sigma-70 factor, ECF subfamily
MSPRRAERRKRSDARAGQGLEPAADRGDDRGIEPGDYVIRAGRIPSRWLVSPMEPRDYPDAQRLERFRDYLRLLTRMQLGRAWGGWLEPSDLVQQTLLEAYQKRDQFRGCTDQAQGAWLRAILARNVADAIRAQGRQKRDIARERSLEAELEASSARLGAWLAADQSTPSEQAVRHEQAVLLANALAQLPKFQREALVLHYWQGCTLAEIGGRLDRTTDAVAGLLKRGLKHLRLALETPS